jgi:hypothetical protein
MPGADAGMPPPDAGAGAPPPDANPDQNAARSMYECGDDDRDAMAKYASGEMDDAGLMSHMQGKRQAYQASAGTAEGAAADNPTNNGTVAAAGVASYSRGGDLVNENSRLKKELYARKARVDRADGERREHYRRAKLQARQSEGFAFDIDDEMQLCGDMSDKQFERHVQHTIAKYERAPIGMAAIYAPPLDRTTADKQKYARDLSERTQKIILREREKGKSLTWDEAGEMAAKELAGSAA